MTALAGLAWTVGGCNILAFPLYLISPAPSGVKVPAEYDGLEDKAVAVVIDADESMLAEHQFLRLQLSDVINRELQEHIDGVKTVGPSRIVRHQDADPDWAAGDRRDMGKRFDADFVLQVTLLDYGMREPGSTSPYRGRITAEAELFCVSLPPAKARVWRGAQIDASYPEGGRPVSRISGGVRELRYETERRFAEALVKKFRTYEVEAEE